MDGLEAAAHIRAQVNIPIIYLTGSSEAALDPAGVTIQKPVSDQTLHQTIQLALATVDPQAPGHPMPRGGVRRAPRPPSRCCQRERQGG
jgi:FixJ family two-component response regulator